MCLLAGLLILHQSPGPVSLVVIASSLVLLAFCSDVRAERAAVVDVTASVELSCQSDEEDSEDEDEEGSENEDEEDSEDEEEEDNEDEDGQDNEEEDGQNGAQGNEEDHEIEGMEHKEDDGQDKEADAQADERDGSSEDGQGHGQNAIKDKKNEEDNGHDGQDGNEDDAQADWPNNAGGREGDTGRVVTTAQDCAHDACVDVESDSSGSEDYAVLIQDALERSLRTQ